MNGESLTIFLQDRWRLVSSDEWDKLSTLAEELCIDRNSFKWSSEKMYFFLVFHHKEIPQVFLQGILEIFGYQTEDNIESMQRTKQNRVLKWEVNNLT